ncbi:MAG: nucleoside monophosphate kinase [Candidatus Melainabacteria bacterium]|nr:nucleoside monophosphate kinase [Candidatus Melainabacteria bacterium]
MMTSPAISEAPITLDTVVFFPFIAPPNGGKGTQTAILSKRFNMPRVDMGSMLRTMAQEETALGNQLRQTLNSGQLVELSVVMDVLKAGIQRELFQKPKGHSLQGFILDGFPRNLAQTEGLLQICQETGARIGKAIYLELPYEVIVERASNRRLCGQCGAIYNLVAKPPEKADVCDVCGSTPLIHRTDDQPEKVQVRLQSFDEETRPIIDRLAALDLLSVVNGNRPMDVITQELEQVIDPFFNSLSISSECFKGID